MIEVMPVVMVRNEERFIVRVLEPLVDVFGGALVGDTGSTDDTVTLARGVPGVEVVEYGPLQPSDVGGVRTRLGLYAKQKGIDWTMLVDGDEIYGRVPLRHIRDNPMPAGKKLGFCTSRMLDEDEATGQIWELANNAGRTCVHPADTRYLGVYPYEGQEWFGQPSLYHYWLAPEGYRYHLVHVHRLRRSARDADVYMRVEKRYTFCLIPMDIPRERPFDMDAWCNDGRD